MLPSFRVGVTKWRIGRLKLIGKVNDDDDHEKLDWN